MKVGSIYVIKNDVNDKVYIGQTTMTVHNRFLDHMKPCTRKRRANYHIYNAINKIGSEHFYYLVLEENIPLEKLNEREIYYIEKYDSFNNGYNSTLGGDGRIINKIEDEQTIIDLYNQGLSCTKIAKKLNVSHSTIWRLLRKYMKLSKDAMTKEELEECINQGMSNKEIAEKFNIHFHSISRIRDKYGLKAYNKKISYRTDFDLDSFKKDYENKMPVNEMLEKYDITRTTMYRIAKQHDIKRK